MEGTGENHNHSNNYDKDDLIKELEEILRDIRLDHQQFVSILEKGIAFPNHIKSFLIQQLESTADANTNSMEMYAQNHLMSFVTVKKEHTLFTE